MLYFAYGSNMNHRLMAGHCPTGQFLFRAVLQHYAFSYDGLPDGGDEVYANINPSPGMKVWGGVFLIDPRCLEALDQYEEFPLAYQRKEVTVVDDQNLLHVALAYYSMGKNPGVPGLDYRREVLRGARDCRLPEDYILQWL